MTHHLVSAALLLAIIGTYLAGFAAGCIVLIGAGAAFEMGCWMRRWRRVRVTS